MVRSLRLALGLMVGWGLVGMLGGGEGAIAIAPFTSTPIETKQLFLKQPQVVLASNAEMGNNVPNYPEDSCKILPSVNEPTSVSLVISLEDTIGKTKLTIAPGSLEKSYPEVEILRKSLEKRIDPEEIKKIITAPLNKDREEQLRLFFNALILNSGFITSKIEKEEDLKIRVIGPASKAIEFRLSVGRLLEIRPELQAGQNQKQDIRSKHFRLPSAFQTYLCERVKLGVNSPLNINQIEDQLRLLREDTAIESIEGILKRSKRGQCLSHEMQDNLSIVGNLWQNLDDEDMSDFSKRIREIDQLIWGGDRKSCLEIRVVKAQPFVTSIGIDNYSPPSVGSGRGSVDMQLRNVGMVGSILGVGYTNSFTGGNEALDFNYQVPLARMNQTLQLRYIRSHNRVTEEQDNLGDLGIRGNSELYAINYRHPLIRTPRRELALSLGLTVQDGQTFIFDQLPFAFGIGPDINGESRTSVIKFGQEYLTRSAKSALSLKSQFNVGTDLFGLFSPTRNAAPIPDGFFFSWQGQAQWLQRLGRDHLLITQVDVQLTPNNLLPQQQFVIGGGQSVRGYRQNSRTGDNGVRFSMEDRITLWNQDKEKRRRDKAGCLPGVAEPRDELISESQSETIEDLLNHPVNQQRRLPDEIGRKNSSGSPSYGLMRGLLDEIGRKNSSGSPSYSLEGGLLVTQPVKTIDCEAPIEDATLFIAPFFDAGYVWNHQDNPNGFPGQRFLASIGLGLGFEAKLSPRDSQPVISVRLDYGHPLVSSNTRGDDFQDAGVHLSIRYRF